MKKLGLGMAVAAGLLAMATPSSAQGSKRVAVAVMDFDFGTIDNWWGQYDLGKGMADQVVDALVNDGTFRVIERKKLDTVLAEQDFSRSDRADPSAAKLSKVGRSWACATSWPARSPSSPPSRVVEPSPSRASAWAARRPRARSTSPSA
jgi:hypothetical protein